MTDKHSAEEHLSFESIYDALRYLVQRLGGSGRVGPMIFPGKNGRAPQHLNDCLNPSEREKLDPEELLALMKLGREAGVHVAVQFIASYLGYEKPKPIDPAIEMAQLQQTFVEGVSVLKQVMERMERVQETVVRRS